LKRGASRRALDTIHVMSSTVACNLVSGVGFRNEGSGFRVWGSGFRVLVRKREKGVAYARESCCSLVFATADGNYTRQSTSIVCLEP
jgi:hypothetical protein